MNRFMMMLVLLILVLFTAVMPAPAAAEDAPVLSLKRLSVGIGADYVAYRPAPVLGLSKSGEIHVVTVASYNLGNYFSVGGSVGYGVDSKEKFFQAGVRLHLLARGSRP